MSGPETVHYMHMMNWLYELPGTFIGDYGDSEMKGRGCQLCNTGPQPFRISQVTFANLKCQLNNIFK